MFPVFSFLRGESPAHGHWSELKGQLCADDQCNFAFPENHNHSQPTEASQEIPLECADGVSQLLIHAM